MGRLSRSRSDHGAVLVEFALILPIIFTLLFGIIDFGIALNGLISSRQGTGVGARQGVVGSFGSDSSCPLSGDAASANSGTKRLLCLTKDRIGLDQRDVRLKLVLGSGGYAARQPMVLCAAYPYHSLTGLFSPVLNHRNAKVEVQMRIEEVATVTPLAATEETPVTGDNWSWCAL